MRATKKMVTAMQEAVFAHGTVNCDFRFSDTIYWEMLRAALKTAPKQPRK